MYSVVYWRSWKTSLRCKKTCGRCNFWHASDHHIGFMKKKPPPSFPRTFFLVAVPIAPCCWRCLKPKNNVLWLSLTQISNTGLKRMLFLLGCHADQKTTISCVYKRNKITQYKGENKCWKIVENMLSELYESIVMSGSFFGSTRDRTPTFVLILLCKYLCTTE